MTTGVPGNFKEVREGVSDRGGGVRSGGEAARKGRGQGKGTAIMKLTTMTQVIPVIHARLFPQTGSDLALGLVESRVDSKGVRIEVYRPAGRPRYAAA
jgi:hypothetical protein